MDRITIADVAKRAGVSISTVSYALSNKRPIADDTKQKIQLAIQDLGYHPNQCAKRLASKEKTRNIGFVLPLEGSELTGLEMKYISGAAKAINEADYTFILLAHSDRNPENVVRFAHNGVVDGFILMEVYMQDERVGLLKQEGFPFVLLGRCADTTGLHYVDLDVAQGMEFGFNQLEGLGHGSIAYLYKDDSKSGLAVRSLQEYKTACKRQNIPILAQSCLLTAEDGEAAMNALLDKQPGINAAFVWNEISASGVARAVQGRGRRIPDDFSIICLVQSNTSNYANFAPVIIDIQAEKMATEAIHLLIALLEDRPILEPQILIPPKLILANE